MYQKKKKKKNCIQRLKTKGNKLSNQLHKVNFKTLSYQKMLNCPHIYFTESQYQFIKSFFFAKEYSELNFLTKFIFENKFSYHSSNLSNYLPILIEPSFTTHSNILNKYIVLFTPFFQRGYLPTIP